MNKKELEKALLTGNPVLIWGPPGVGKTALVRAVAREMELPLEMVIASVREPSDFAGLPVVGPEGVFFEPPAWAKRLAKAGRGILFFDEISTAPPAVQAALLRVVLDRVVGDLELPPDVYIVAAANPPEMAAGGWELSLPLRNRFDHFEFQLDPLDWAENFPTYWGNPPETRLDQETWAQARSIVAGFIRARPELLLRVPSGASASQLSFPTPRSWERASRHLAVAGLSAESAFKGIQAAVGEGAALEFISWAQEANLPNPEDLLRSPGKVTLPERGDLVFAILSAVATAVVLKPTPKRWEAAWEIFAQAVDQYPDIAAAAAKPLARMAGSLGIPKALERIVPKLGPILAAAEGRE